MPTLARLLILGGMDHKRESIAGRDGPPRLKVGGCLIIAAATLLTFVGGIATSFQIKLSVPPKVAYPTEVYEGFGDFADALYRLVIGVFLSLLAAGAACATATTWMVLRQCGEPPERCESHQRGQFS